MTRRRAPNRITLVLIGTAALAGCSQDPPQMARDHYATLEDCAADWGQPENCDRVQSSGYGAVPFIFRGPAYAMSNRPAARQEAIEQAQRAGRLGLVDPARQGRAIATAIEPTARGGFGSRSRSYASFGS